MKILYVDIAGNGGHGPAYRYAMTNSENKNVYILPCEVKDITGNVYIKLCTAFTKTSRFSKLLACRELIEWMKYIRSVAEKEHPDIIHFLVADFFVFFWGIGLNILKDFKVVLSFHGLKRSFLKSISRNIIVSQASAFTSHVMGAEKQFFPANRRKYHFVPYPSALENISFTTEQAREFLNIHTDRKIIAFVGEMRSGKGIEVLLKALPKVKQPYYLLFAGSPKRNKEFLEAELAKIDAPKTVILRYISDEEFVACIAASDILAVPYQKNFGATSGPMTEAIRLKKTIVGSNHSNIGQYIKHYSIGYSCKAGDVEGLTEALEKALRSPVVYTAEMEKLAEAQTVQAFRRNIDSIYRSVLQ